jgi:ABC-type ATPase involved in cell division
VAARHRIAGFLVAREEAGREDVAESGEIMKVLNETRDVGEAEVSLTQVCRVLSKMEARGLVELVEGYGPSVRDDLGALITNKIYAFLERAG